MNERWQLITRRWLARLSFTFLVIAFFLGWEGYKLYSAGDDHPAGWRPLLYLVAAALSAVLAFTGLRERHRPDRG